MISVHFQGKPLNITVIQVYAPTSNAEEAEQFYEELQDLLELTLEKCSFHHRGLGCKSRKSRDKLLQASLAWSTKRSRTKVEFCQENALVIANTLFQQHKRQLYMWTSPDGQY